MIDLSGTWELSLAEHDRNSAPIVVDTIPIPLPGDSLSAFYAAGCMPGPPYWGQNETEVCWVSELDWIARRTVQLDRTDLDLIVTDLDTVVEILLGSSFSDIRFRKILLITGKTRTIRILKTYSKLFKSILNNLFND
jgi:hypothetical protein